jgi:methanogenic corrinoid protein MtbC1
MLDAPTQAFDSARAPLDYRRYWLALLRRDVTRAERIFDDALERFGPARVYLRLLAPAQVLSGAEWQRGAIAYRDEHFITHHTIRLMRRARRALVVPSPTGPVALAVAVAQESHRLGLRMVCDFLQSRNWRVAWLRDNDRATLRAAILEPRPRAILFSIGMTEGIEPAHRLIEEARRQGFDGFVIIGGRAIDHDASLVSRLGADLTAKHGLQLVRKLKRLGVG